VILAVKNVTTYFEIGKGRDDNIQQLYLRHVIAFEKCGGSNGFFNYPTD
jgi:hypothetical protein